MLDGNGWKQRFHFHHRWKWNFHFCPFLSSTLFISIFCVTPYLQLARGGISLLVGSSRMRDARAYHAVTCIGDQHARSRRSAVASPVHGSHQSHLIHLFTAGPLACSRDVQWETPIPSLLYGFKLFSPGNFLYRSSLEIPDIQEFPEFHEFPILWVFPKFPSLKKFPFSKCIYILDFQSVYCVRNVVL